METIHRTYRFELRPTQEQKVLLDKHFGCVRFVYNHFLNARKAQYQANKQSDNYYAQAKTLTELKKQEETVWLKEVNSQTLQEGIKCIVHREVKGEVGKMTFSKTPTGRYFVSILTEEQYQPKEKTGAVCGADLGLKAFAITSDGIKFKNNRYTKKYESDLAKAQKHLSRKQKGSNGFEKQKLKVANIHEKISNTRQDVLHKVLHKVSHKVSHNVLHNVSHQLVSDYYIIALEALNVKGMMSNRKLSKHIADAGWGGFVRLLEYKADWNDKQVVKINRFYPGSKTCCECGWINQDLNLSVREWTCKNGHHLDRDENAAKNILNEGLKIISSGTGNYTVGDLN